MAIAKRARYRSVLLGALIALFATVPIAAQSASSVHYSPCTHIGGNSQSGYTLTAVTSEYIADCDAVDAYRMRYVNLSGNTVTAVDSGTGTTTDSFTRSGYLIDYTQHRAKETSWGSLWTLWC